jgi:hypothetical protein
MKKKVAAGKSQTCRPSEWQSHCRNESSILMPLKGRDLRNVKDIVASATAEKIALNRR